MCESEAIISIAARRIGIFEVIYDVAARKNWTATCAVTRSDVNAVSLPVASASNITCIAAIEELMKWR